MDQQPSILKLTWQRAPAVSIIIAINLAVFLLWYAADRSPALADFMVRHFLVSSTRLEAGYWWTLLTSAFSHGELWHFGINMFVLWSFGIVLEQFWGSRVFVAFYLVASIVGSASHCFTSSFVIGDGAVPALGASGAVSGLLLAYALHFPRAKILLFGIIPLPAIVGVLGFVALDIWGLVAQSHGGGYPIGHGAHLGGALAGALMWAFYLRKQFAARRAPSLTRAEAEMIERIRTKVEAHGPDSLTPEERDFVIRLQQRGR